VIYPSVIFVNARSLQMTIDTNDDLQCALLAQANILK